MKEKRISMRRNGFALLELLLTAIIVLLLFFAFAKLYLKKSPLDKESQQSLQQQGIDTTNYKTTLDSTKAKLKAIEAQRAQELEGLQ
jgi:Tfp pilus assembly protein PilV